MPFLERVGETENVHGVQIKAGTEIYYATGDVQLSLPFFLVEEPGSARCDSLGWNFGSPANRKRSKMKCGRKNGYLCDE